MHRCAHLVCLLHHFEDAPCGPPLHLLEAEQNLGCAFMNEHTRNQEVRADCSACSDVVWPCTTYLVQRQGMDHLAEPPIEGSASGQVVTLRTDTDRYPLTHSQKVAVCTCASATKRGSDRLS